MPAFWAARTWGFLEAGCGGGETDVRVLLGLSRSLTREGSLGETARRAAREWTVDSEGRISKRVEVPEQGECTLLLDFCGFGHFGGDVGILGRMDSVSECSLLTTRMARDF